MNKQEISQLSKLLPGKDPKVAERLISNHRYNELMEIVETDIRKLERIED